MYISCFVNPSFSTTELLVSCLVVNSWTYPMMFEALGTMRKSRCDALWSSDEKVFFCCLI